MKRAFASSVVVAMCAVFSVAFAAPVTYSFSTGPVISGGFGEGASFLSAVLSGLSVSGTFNYDAQALATGAASNGSTIYGGPSGPLSSLAGTVGGFSFSDPRGFALVGNDLPISIFPAADSVQLFADSSNASLGIHNISGFAIGSYSLFNVRLFWIEGSTTPELIPDFLSDQSLPDPLPTFHGRLALDFVQTGNSAGPQSDVFFDNLTVTVIPEPEAYAMLLAGLGLLGFAARRRKLKANAAA